MINHLLDPIRVVDLTTEEGWQCGRFLASLGAQVIRVDLSSLVVDQTWRLGNADKQCVSIDYDTPVGAALLAGLIGDCDMVIESFRPGHMAELGLGLETLRALNPALVMVSITPFGQDGPYAGYRAGELVVAAMSGIMSVNGHADRWPLKEPGNAHYFHASIVGAAGGIAALYQARREGRGQQVDISAQEVGASRNTIWTIAYQFDGRRCPRLGPLLDNGRGPVQAVYETRDGHAVLAMAPPGSAIATAVGRWMSDLGYENPLVDYQPGSPPQPELLQRWSQALARFLRDRTREEFLTDGLARKAYVLPVNLPHHLLDDLQFGARGLLADALGGSEPLQLPQWFVLTNAIGEEAVMLPDRPLPLDTLSVLPKRKRAVAGNAGTPTSAQRSLPLAGIKVMDFSWAIVGNTAAKMLGDLGAIVVKIESGKRVAIERTSVPVSNVAPGVPNNNPWFANVATSKRSLQLEMQNPAAGEVVEALIDWADIVFENFSPGVMERLGLSYEKVRAKKPSIIMASGSIFGQSGPLSPLPGTDLSGAAWSSRLAMTGDPDRGPVLPSATYGDSVTPFALTAAMVAAVMRRDATGEGCRIDASMAEILVQQMLPAVVAAQRDIRSGGSGLIPRLGNRSATASPHNVFPALGEDRWVAIEVGSETEFASLCCLMGHPELAADPRYRTLADRKAHEAQLEALVAAYTRELNAYELMQRLQLAGIAAGVVQNAQDIVTRDPQIAHRGYLQVVAHAVLGPFAHQRTPIGLSETPGRMFAAPKLGEHTEEICRDLLGLGNRYADLRARGVFG